MTGETLTNLAAHPLRVWLWRMFLQVIPGEALSLTTTPAGVHAVVSSWLHQRPDQPQGEPHDREHHYNVRWQQLSEGALLLEIRIFDEMLVPVLLQRVHLDALVQIGQVRLRVGNVEEVGMIDLADLVGQPARRWDLSFPEGVTFKRGDVFTPWPSPMAVLGSIQRKWAMLTGQSGPQRLPREITQGVLPIAVDLETIKWPEANTRRGARDVTAAVGELRWICTAEPAVAAHVDWLLQAGQLLGVGAKTSWGLGVLEIISRAQPRGVQE